MTPDRVLDVTPRTRHAPCVMSSARVTRMLELASELGEDERLELAEELWEHVPEKLSPAWEAELRRRARDMDAAQARGEASGIVLTVDEAIAQARRPGNDEE
jgi:putative addiction module component (TIGR02574 family)